MKRTVAIMVVLTVLVCLADTGFPHCQIPCGIYDDRARVNLIKEDITTIEKSINEINALSAEQKKNYNQIVRWVMNKEEHADRIIDTVTDYFIAQRIKPAEMSEGKTYTEYAYKLSLLHKLIFYSMKSKQEANTAHTAELTEVLDKFSEVYLGKITE